MNLVPIDTACFEKFLELFSQTYPNEIHIIQLDNGRAHLGLDLSIPDNIILLFQPPYCPEVNPIERLWKEIKKILKNKVFDRLDFLRKKLANILTEFSQKDIASITGYDFILEALSVVGLQEIGITKLLNTMEQVTINLRMILG